MALWVLGWIQRIFSDNTLTIIGAYALVTVVIAALNWKYCSMLLTDPMTLAIVSALGVLLNSRLHPIESDPLPAGMYTPAAPIGFLFLLAGLVAWMSGGSVLAGVACGLAILTKQDFSLPAGVILIACVVKDRSRGWIAGLCAGAIVAAGAAQIVAQAGWPALERS